MPQATLLKFFKSQTPGPFGSAVCATGPPPSQEGSELTQDVDATRTPAQTYFSRSTTQRASKPQSRDLTWPSEDEAKEASGRSAEPPLPGLTIVPVQTEHIPALKRLTGNLLPVRYPDKFFDGAVSEEIPATFSRVALVDGKPVGWIRCRLDPFPEPTVPPSKTKPIYNRIYVQALCVLAPYRGLGIATSLLSAVTASPLPSTHGIAHVYAHVWESNEEALEWYDRRGFGKIMKVEQYYRKLRPGGAWIVKKDFEGTLS